MTGGTDARRGADGFVHAVNERGVPLCGIAGMLVTTRRPVTCQSCAYELAGQPR